MAGMALTALTAGGLALIPQAASATQDDSARTVEFSRPASAAKAAELSVLADSHGCSGNEASNNSYVHVCFVRDGDKVWVRDDEANGRAAVGEIDFIDAGVEKIRACVNRSGAAGSWGYCAWPEADEHTTAYYHGYDIVGSDFNTAAHFTGVQSEPTT